MRTVYSIGEALQVQETHRAKYPRCKCLECEMHHMVTLPAIEAFRATLRGTT